MTISKMAVILEIERALPVDGWPPYIAIEVTARLGRLERLLLFVMYLDDQAHNSDDDQTELKQLRVSQHKHPLLSLEGARSPLRDGEANRLPYTGSAER